MLSDLMMAGMDGLALLERAKERTPEMPVVMVTRCTTFPLRWPRSAMAPTIIC